jgi:hypothetical protein
MCDCMIFSLNNIKKSVCKRSFKMLIQDMCHSMWSVGEIRDYLPKNCPIFGPLPPSVIFKKHSISLSSTKKTLYYNFYLIFVGQKKNKRKCLINYNEGDWINSLNDFFCNCVELS